MLDTIEGYIIDLDGTVYKGKQLIDGAAEAVAFLKSRGKRIVFLSNRGNISRRTCYEKLTGLGLDVAEEEIVLTSTVTARYLQRHYPGCRTWVLGEQGLKDELAAYGVEQASKPELADWLVITLHETVTYGELNEAFRAVRSGARIIATNADKTFPGDNGDAIDVAGMIGAIIHSTDAQVEVVVGKPSALMAEAALDILGLPPERCIVIGDSLASDIELGQRAGMMTALVLTGSATREMALAAVKQPDRVWNSLADACAEGSGGGGMTRDNPTRASSQAGNLFPETILVERNAAAKAVPYIASTGREKVLIVADTITAGIVGDWLRESLVAAGVNAGMLLITPNRNGDVVADEASIVQLLLEIQKQDVNLLVAAGSGTIHDIVRYAGHTAGVPFVSVPTAPSVDGFTSRSAPLLIRGEKITVPAVGPLAIFADLDILCAAPQKMVAAGFGDMLGKYTSLFDWRYGRDTAGEPYDAKVAEMTEQALLNSVRQVEEIGRRSEEGIRTLTNSLIESGLAMLLFGQSHPASGAEHHLSHYWEMAFIQADRRQLLHGAKVGVACAEISELYHLYADSGRPLPEDSREQLGRIPSPDAIRTLLKIAGGPSTIEELGIDSGLRARSLQEAHQIRMNRHTLLRTING